MEGDRLVRGTEVIERAFAGDEPIPLPEDIFLHWPQKPYLEQHPTENAKCSGCAGGEPNKDSYIDKVLAISPKTASYIALHKDVEPALRLAMEGLTPRAIVERLARESGKRRAERIVSNLLTNIVFRNFLRDTSVSEYQPTHPNFQLYITNQCNLRCRHCYMSSGQAYPDEIPVDLQIKALELYARRNPGGRVTVTGGEALTKHSVWGLLEAARQLDLRVELYSNGLTIKSEATLERLSPLIDELQISLDGATESVNDGIRGIGSYKSIIRAIRLTDKFLKEKPNFEFRIAITLTPTNASDILFNLPELIQSLHLSSSVQVRIGSLSSLGRAKIQSDFSASTIDILDMQAKIAARFVELGLFKVPRFANNRFSRTCGMGATITLAANGNIYPCSVVDQPPIGHISDSDAEEKFSSVLGYMEATNVDNVSGCRDCSLRYSCGGMCRIKNLFSRGSMTSSACTPEFKAFKVRDLISKYDSFAVGSSLETLFLTEKEGATYA